MKKRWVLAVGLLLVLPSLAQESPSYTLQEQTFNAGGHPAEGTIVSSASFRITLDGVGETVAAAGLASPSFHVNAGFTADYRPPGEATGLHFIDEQTLRWNPERSVGAYNLYRDLISTLSSLGFGTCFRYDLTGETTSDAGLPPANSGWFYLVTAENRLAEEGTKGSRSNGTARANPSPCP